MPAGGRTEQPERSGLYLAITVAAVLVAVYFAFQVIGFLFKLFFLALAVAVAWVAYKAWRGTR